MDYLINMSIGRSGSTLMNGILNSFSGVLMRGENHFYMEHLSRAHRSLKKTCEMENIESITSPFFGGDEFNLTQWFDIQRVATEKLLLGSKKKADVRILGFKEIRFIELGMDEIVDHLQFLDLLLPNFKIIFHQRDLYQISTSGWWAEYETSELMSKFRDYENYLLLILETQFSERYLVTKYESVLENPKTMVDQLSEFLGVTPNLHEVHQAISTEHSWTTSRGGRLLGTKTVDLFPTINRTW